MTDPGKPSVKTDPFEHPDVWIFDLDNTLYPSECRLFDQIDVRMGTYIANFLGVEYDEARKVQKDYFRNYGTTLRGLMSVHGAEPQSFLDYVHDIDLSPLPDARRMEQALGRLDGRKIVFTNASLDYAERVLDQLGISHHFEDVFGIEAADYLPKPDINAYRKFIDRHGIDPNRSAMIEDMAQNLEPARELGMTTVWVPNNVARARESPQDGHIDHVIENLEAWLVELAESMPQR